MSFTYDPTTLVGQVRSLIPDTDASAPVFSDEEIQVFINITSSQGLYASGQAQPTAASRLVVPQIYSVRLAAATALDVIASKLSQSAAIEQLLDVKQSCDKAAEQARKSACALREAEENMGHFAIAEMVSTEFAARERVWAQLLRLEGGS